MVTRQKLMRYYHLIRVETRLADAREEILLSHIDHLAPSVYTQLRDRLWGVQDEIVQLWDSMPDNFKRHVNRYGAHGGRGDRYSNFAWVYRRSKPYHLVSKMRDYVHMRRLIKSDHLVIPF